MRTLILKELQSVLPFFVLVILLELLSSGLLYFALSSPDQIPPSKLLIENVAIARLSFLIYAVLALAAANTVIVGELDRGTSEFLATLPVSLHRIFMGKALAVLSVLVFWSALDLGNTLVVRFLSATSLEINYSLDVILPGMFRSLVFAYFTVGFVLVLSFLRRFAWPILPLIILVVDAVETRSPALAAFLPSALLSPIYEGRRLVLPTTALLATFFWGTAGYLAAWRLYLGAGPRFLNGLANLVRRRSGRVVLVFGLLLIAATWTALAVHFGSKHDLRGEEENVLFRDWTTATARTQHYVILYPTRLEAQARPLIESADDVHARVQRFLSAAPIDEITVDATRSLRHVNRAGQAEWKTITVDLLSDIDPPTLLAHETTHVYAAALSNQRTHDFGVWTAFINEGLATYLEARPHEALESIRHREVAAAFARHHQQDDLKILMDAQLFERKYSADLLYSLGLQFVCALVDQHGDESVGRLLTSLGRADAPEKFTDGLDLWRDTFQAVDLDFEAVTSRYYARLDALVDRHRALVDAVPVLFAQVHVEETDVIIQVSTDSKAVEGPFEMSGRRFHVVARFRPGPDASHKGVVERAWSEGELRMPLSFFLGDAVSFQLGIRDENNLELWQPWIETRL